jgi:hypothetical protein
VPDQETLGVLGVTVLPPVTLNETVSARPAVPVPFVPV